ncbi:hypothetical protein ACLMJK_003085 [Lecanora helva]
MARRARLSTSQENDEQADTTAKTARRDQEHVNVGSLSPSPTASFSSDKENRQTPAPNSRQGKGKIRDMGPPQLPTPEIETSRSTKRRKLSQRDAPNATQTTHAKHLADVANTDFYDPEQSIAERRAVRKDFRDLSRELTDSRAEYLAPGSKGLLNTLSKANELFTSVKQTSDATLDSRLLVSTADLSAKRTTQLTLGESTTGIDVDDFVGKCISFMRRAPANGASRRRTQGSDDEGAEDYDEGDAFNWEYLGRQACFPNNVRPPVPGFLLGPLSVQKKIRKATQRRERLQRRDPNEAVRPEEMKAQDFEKSENSNLTTICTKIRDLIAHTMTNGRAGLEAELTDDITDEDAQALLEKHNIADDEGVPFFRFVVNPKSFGQTVENLFYVSFLIKDGKVGLGNDSRMLPTLRKFTFACEAMTFIDTENTDATEARTAQEIKEQNVSKHQAVFHLDFETWEDLIETFNIKKGIIPHRHTEEEVQISASGWYG